MTTFKITIKKFIIFFLGILLATILVDYFYHSDIYQALPDSVFYFIKIILAALVVTLLSLILNKKFTRWIFKFSAISW